MANLKKTCLEHGTFIVSPKHDKDTYGWKYFVPLIMIDYMYIHVNDNGCVMGMKQQDFQSL
jgi:hypothetical protein